MERRFSPTSVAIEKRVDGCPLIVGYASVFFRDDDPGTEYEILPGLVEHILPTAFNRSLSEGHDAAGLINHDPQFLMGRVSSNTMRLSVDSRGLRYEIDPPDTQYARDAMVSIARGDITGSSFGFSVPKDGANLRSGKQRDIREVIDVDLFDVSLVTFPAYTSTSSSISSGVRSDGDDAELRAEWELFKRLQRADERIKELRG